MPLREVRPVGSDMKKNELKFWSVIAIIIYGGMVIGTLMLWTGGWIASKVLK